MSGLEALGIVASVVQIADAGARLAVKLYTFSHRVKSADNNVQNISTDVAVTCTVLRELGETLRKDEETKLSNHNAIATAERVIGECGKIFGELEAALDGSQCDAAGGEKGKGKGVLQRIGRGVGFAIKEPQIELLRCHLERLKSTLLLMLNVIIYAGQLRSKEAPAIMQEQRELIRALNEAKKENEKKADDLAKAIEGIGSLRIEVARGASPDSASRSMSTSTTSFVQQPGGHLDSRKREPSTDRTPKHSQPQTDQSIPSLEAQLSNLGELGNYCTVVKSLLQNIVRVQDKIQAEYHTNFREAIIDSHSKNAQSLMRQHGQEKVYRAFRKCFIHPLHAPGVDNASTAWNDVLLASRITELGRGYSGGMFKTAKPEPGKKSSSDHLEPPVLLGPRLTLQPPDADQPRTFTELQSPPPRTDLLDQSNQVMYSEAALYPCSPARSDGGLSPTVSFSGSEAPDYEQYEVASPVSPRSEGRSSISLKRDRDPPKNSEGQVTCDHEDCRGNPPSYRRLSEWNKHMDKHERPYKCAERGCASLQGFTYSGGLLRHQREVHKQNGAAKVNLKCPHVGCNRNTSHGFTRLENLKEHLRRRHQNSSEDSEAQAEDAVDGMAEKESEPKRRRIDADDKGGRETHEKVVAELTEGVLNLERRALADKLSDEAGENDLESVDDLLLYWTNVPKSALE